MKKIIITLTILSFLNLIGCYYQEQMNPSDFNFNDEEDMEVTTKDTTYNLSGKDYYFENDTLFTTVTKKLDNKTNFNYNINIPAEEIKILEVKKLDATSTARIIGVLSLVTFGIAFIISLSNIGG